MSLIESLREHLRGMSKEHRDEWVADKRMEEDE